MKTTTNKPTAKTKTKAKAKTATSRRAKSVPRSEPTAIKAAKPEDKPLDYREQRFVDLYLASEKLDPYQAAIDAGYAHTVARTKSYSWVGNSESKPHVYAAIKAGMARLAAEAGIDQAKIVKELERGFFADANELTEFRRTCCRFCHGIDNGYQRTPNEMKRAKHSHAVKMLEAKAAGIKLTSDEMKFDEEGGIGYDPRKAPSLECPECFGEGVGEVHIKDTRNLSPEARALYGGVKRTKEGLEVNMHSKHAAGQLLMRHLGMLNDKITHKGDAENPLVVSTKVVIVPQKSVAQVSTKPITKGSDD